MFTILNDYCWCRQLFICLKYLLHESYSFFHCLYTNVYTGCFNNKYIYIFINNLLYLGLNWNITWIYNIKKFKDRRNKMRFDLLFQKIEKFSNKTFNIGISELNIIYVPCKHLKSCGKQFIVCPRLKIRKKCK